MKQCCETDLIWSVIPASTEPSAQFVIEEAICEKCGAEYQRKEGNEIAYKDFNGKITCTKCGGIAEGAQIAHAIWDGPFPMSGSGKCDYETVPYCPNCEKKPDYHGKPIRAAG